MNPQAKKLFEKLVKLGIKPNSIISIDGLTSFNFFRDDDILSIGINKEAVEGNMDTAIIIWKGETRGPLQPTNSQYVIDNLETIYNSFSS